MFLWSLEFEVWNFDRSCLEHFDKSFLRYVHRTKGFHALLAFLLFLQKFAFAGDVAAVTFRSHILAQRAHRFARDDFSADGGLNGDDILLARNDFFELGGQ